LVEIVADEIFGNPRRNEMMHQFAKGASKSLCVIADRGHRDLREDAKMFSAFASSVFDFFATCFPP
jgi:hypothetical protein